MGKKRPLQTRKLPAAPKAPGARRGKGKTPKGINPRHLGQQSVVELRAEIRRARVAELALQKTPREDITRIILAEFAPCDPSAVSKDIDKLMARYIESGGYAWGERKALDLADADRMIADAEEQEKRALTGSGRIMWRKHKLELKEYRSRMEGFFAPTSIRAVGGIPGSGAGGLGYDPSKLTDAERAQRVADLLGRAERRLALQAPAEVVKDAEVVADGDGDEKREAREAG